MNDHRPLLSGLVAIAIGFASCDKVTMPYEPLQGGGPGTEEVVRKVLLEDCTGHRCNNCPAAAAQAQLLQSIHGDNLVVVAVHCVNGFAAPQAPIGDDVLDSDHRAVPEGATIEDHFDITFLPAGLVNRIPYNNILQLSEGDWAAAVGATIGQPTPFHLWFDTLSYGGGTVSTVVKLAILAPVTGDHNLVVALTEDHVIDWQINVEATPPEVPNYDHRHMLRRNLNGTWGVPAIVGSAQTGDTLTFPYPGVALTNVLNADNCALVAYVYNTTTDEVMQVEERKFQP